MKPKAVAILVAAAVVIAAVAMMLNRDGSTTSASDVPAALFPELQNKINDVASIDVKRGGSSESFSIVRTGNTWGLASKGGYPVNIEQVKAAVVGIAQLKPIEAKTSNPELYSKIGVQDPTDEAPADPEDAPVTQPTLVTLKDAQGTVLASLIIGTQKWGNTPSIFVRKAGEKQSWLAEGRLEVPTDAMQWIERQVLNIGRDRIRNVVILHPSEGTEVEVSRKTPSDSFEVVNMPPGRELTAPTAPETLVTGVQYLSVDDIRPLDQVSFDEPKAIAVYRTFDGLTITARTVRKDDKDWVNLTFAAEPAPAEPAKEGETPEASEGDKPADDAKAAEAKAAEVKKEAEELSAKLSKWAFAIPEYKSKNLTASIETILKPLPEPPPAPIAPEETTESPATEEPAPVGPEPEQPPTDE